MLMMEEAAIDAANRNAMTPPIEETLPAKIESGENGYL
jgi:hypothetical protein